MLPSFLTNPDPNIYNSDKWIVFDYETTNLHKGSALEKGNRIVLATWLLGPGLIPLCRRSAGTYDGVHFKYGNEYEQQELGEAICAADFIVAHNAKFELQWLDRSGIDTSKLLVFDTMLGEYVRLGNRRGPKDLDSLLKRYKIGQKNQLVKRLIRSGICPSEIPHKWLTAYGCADTYGTKELFLKQRAELRDAGLLPTLFTRCITTPVLADIEKNGMQLDGERVREEYDVIAGKLEQVNADLADQAGNINFRSSKQLAALLYDKLGFAELLGRGGEPKRTAGGGRCTDAATISMLDAKTEAQRRFSETISLYSNLKYEHDTIGKMLACVEENGGLLQARFNQSVTQTHRLSSSGEKYAIQFQNIKRTFKRLFKARRPEWLVGESDGAQLEFRVAAHLGRDARAGHDIRTEFDVHRFTASVLNRVSEDAVTKAQRQDAKPHTFKPLYGGRSGTKREVEYYAAFRARYPGIYNTQQGWTTSVLRNKKLRTETGLYFYWPDTKLDARSGYITNSTSIFNYPVQSLATADIIPIALVYMWHRLRAAGLQAFIVNTIHDSIIAEVHPSSVEGFQELSRTCFTDDVFSYLGRVYRITFSVPLGVETKVGTHWNDGIIEEFKYNAELNAA